MIKIIDDLTPEDLAMLQALYSRSPASVDTHLEKVKRVGSGSFMDRYYVGYGDASIGDCGTTTLFIEGVTMLAAKAIQDWPLYSGQEASTRYMDFSHVEFHNPLNNELGAEIQDAWRAFYLKAHEPVLAHLRAKYRRQDGEDQKAYDGAIAARAFDILRAFLPAGASTNLSWHTNLRQAADHLTGMLWHPDPAVEALARELLAAISAKYPHTFGRVEAEAARSVDDASWEREVALDHHLTEEDFFIRDDVEKVGRRASSATDDVREEKPLGPVFGYVGDVDTTVDTTVETTIIVQDWDEWTSDLLATRPRGKMIPRRLAELGHLCSEFLLDFGSFRDLQRHRNGVVRMPILTTECGFHEWYLAELPSDLAVEAIALIEKQVKRIKVLGGPKGWTRGAETMEAGATRASEYVRQSYIAMGFRVPCRVTQSLPAFVYRLELRSSKTVHPTLRAIVLEEIALFKALFPRITIHVDTDPDSWTVRRGGQTITEKQ